MTTSTSKRKYSVIIHGGLTANIRSYKCRVVKFSFNINLSSQLHSQVQSNADTNSYSETFFTIMPYVTWLKAMISYEYLYWWEIVLYIDGQLLLLSWEVCDQLQTHAPVVKRDHWFTRLWSSLKTYPKKILQGAPFRIVYKYVRLYHTSLVST